MRVFDTCNGIHTPINGINRQAFNTSSSVGGFDKSS
jgi:hypothetical protein